MHYGTILGALRKSVVRPDKRKKTPDELAASLRLQRKKIETALGGDGNRFIWAEDEGVSGAVSPFRRPHLGPMLADLDSWQALAVARFDRVSRSVRDFSDFIDWLRHHGKILICLDPPIDLSTPGGRAFAQMLAVFAEYEREMIRERVTGSWHDLRDAGKWPGGTIPFGRMPVPDGDGWRLVPDPEYQPHAFEIARRYVAGESFHTIAARMLELGVPMPRDTQRVRNGKAPVGKGWTAATVRTVLSSPGLGGLLPTGKDLRRDADNVLIHIDPLLPPELYEQLQQALQGRAYGRNVNASGLLGVAFCFFCSAPLYGTSHRNPSGNLTRSYRCDRARDGKCSASSVEARYLEAKVADLFLRAVGDQKILEPVYIAAVDHSAELADVLEAMDNLEAQYAAGNVYKGEEGARRFASLMARLEARQAKLAAVASTPARTEYRKTDSTFRDKWNASDPNGQRVLMASSGFRLYFARTPRDPGEIAREEREIGRGRTPRQLATRESHIRAKAPGITSPATRIRLETELAEIIGQRRQLREIPRWDEFVAAPIGPELARRAGLAASGQVVDLPDNEETWEQLLAPARQVLRRPRPVS